MTISRFSFPTDIQFGPGASKLVGDHLRERGFRRPIVVTDKGLAALPVLKNFVANLMLEQLKNKSENINYEQIIANMVSHIMTFCVGYKAASLKSHKKYNNLRKTRPTKKYATRKK